MATTIFPTTNDVSAAPGGGGKGLSEPNLSGWLKALAGTNFVVSGFTLPSSDPDLTISIGAGEAVIEGYRVVIDTATGLALAPNATNHIYLKLTRDGAGNVNGAAFEVNTAGIQPAESVYLAQAVTNATSVTSTVDKRPLGLMVFQTRVVNVPSVRVYHDAYQSIISSTYTALEFNREDFDTDEMHDTVTNNSRLTVRTAGKYLIMAQVAFEPNTTGLRSLHIRRNGAINIASISRYAEGQGVRTELSVTTLYALVTGDYVEAVVSQESGGPLEVPPNMAVFSMVRVGD